MSLVQSNWKTCVLFINHTCINSASVLTVKYFLQTTEMHIRVEDVENSVDDVGDEVDVALSASASCVHAERLLGSKAEEQQFGIVDVELVRGLPLACALLKICVVPVW